MPSLIDIRRRIRSVRNTQQITKAMKMVSAAKLRRAQERVLAARPYAALIREMLASVSSRVSSAEGPPHALLERRRENSVLLLLLTGDKGLAGAFNTNLIKASQAFLVERSSRRVELELIGRKGRDFYRRRQVTISGEHVNVFGKVEYGLARAIAQKEIARFVAREVDAVYLLYNEFKSVLSQKLVIDRVLPLSAPAAGEAGAVEYIYEEPVEQILAGLLPRYVEVQIYRAMLESAAAEHAARMTAMDAATSNAAEMIDKLTLYMNRVRQASITKEIIEVVSGAAVAAE